MNATLAAGVASCSLRPSYADQWLRWKRKSLTGIPTSRHDYDNK